MEVESEGGGNPGFTLERSEDEKLIWLAMEGMEPLFKNILVLREVEDMSYEDLSEVLRVGIGTVKSRLFRARAVVLANLGRPCSRYCLRR